MASLAEMREHGLIDLLDGRLNGHAMGLHHDVGLGVDRIANRHQAAQRLLRVGGLQQRPVGTPGHPLVEGVEIGLQPERSEENTSDLQSLMRKLYADLVW